MTRKSWLWEYQNAVQRNVRKTEETPNQDRICKRNTKRPGTSEGLPMEQPEELAEEETEEMQLHPGGSDDQPKAENREGVQLQPVSKDEEELPHPTNLRVHRAEQREAHGDW